MTHTPEQQPQDVREQTPMRAAEWSVLHEVADSGDIEKIITEAHLIGCYDTALEAFKHDMVYRESSVRDVLEGAPPLSQKDWDRLLALWLYDVETAHHTLRTYALVHRILRARPELAAAIMQEGVPLEEEELATILHDIGKLCIPRSVLNNTLSSTDAGRILVEKLSQQDPVTVKMARERLGKEVTAENVHDMLEQKHVRPIHVLPLEYVVTQTEHKELNLRGFEADGKSLMDIIAQHEKFTGLLLCPDHPIAGEVAAHHHSASKCRYQTSAALLGTTSRISAELVTAVDEIDAISSRRTYKKAEPFSRALTNELRRHRDGMLSSFVTYHVLSELSRDISQKEREDCPDEVQAIADFIAEYEKDVGSHRTEVSGEKLAA